MNSKSLKIGIYGGTFNPIHFGHINLALELQEKHQLDLVYICPTGQNPLRPQETIPAHHRLEMTKLGIGGITSFKLLDCEVRSSGPNYTIDTLHDLKSKDEKQGHHNSYFLIVGQDVIQNFTLWKDPQKIIEIAPLLIGQRSSEPVSVPENAPQWLKHTVSKGLTPIRVLEISGTEIRDRLKKGLYCGHLVPQKVLDYIKDHHLYY